MGCNNEVCELQREMIASDLKDMQDDFYKACWKSSDLGQNVYRTGFCKHRSQQDRTTGVERCCWIVFHNVSFCRAVKLFQIWLDVSYFHLMLLISAVFFVHSILRGLIPPERSIFLV
jgi:hypothetical protein